MTAHLDHVAINARDFEETVRFFEEVFHMEISWEAGAMPHRRLWFHQGIQINETADACRDNSLYNHIALRVSDKAEAIEAAKAYGCVMVEGKDHWIVTPGGIVIELMA